MALITWLSERVGHIIVFAMLKETLCVTFDLTQLSPGKKVPSVHSHYILYLPLAMSSTERFIKQQHFRCRTRLHVVN